MGNFTPLSSVSGLYYSYYDYDYYTGTTYSDYSSTAKYEDILYHYTPYNTHIADSVRVNDTETEGDTLEESSNVSLMITEVSDDVLDDNVTLGVSDGVDIALNSDDTKTTLTEDAADESDDKMETESSDLEDLQTAADAVSDEKVNPSTTEHTEKQHGEGVNWTTVKIVAMDDESDDIEDTQISATFYETLSETENVSDFSKEASKKDYKAETAGNLQSLSQENLSPEEDDKDSNEDIIGVDEDSYDGMFSTEADTAEVSAVEFIVDDYYEHEVTLENPIAYFEDIEDEDMFSSASGLQPHDIEDLEISGSGEILEDVSSSAEFYEDLNVNKIDEYMEEEISGTDLFEDTEAGSSLFSTIENLFEENVNSTADEDEISTQINIVNSFDMDWGRKGESRHPKLISSWQEKSGSCRIIFLSCNILLPFSLSFNHIF